MKEQEKKKSVGFIPSQFSCICCKYGRFNINEHNKYTYGIEQCGLFGFVVYKHSICGYWSNPIDSIIPNVPKSERANHLNNDNKPKPPPTRTIISGRKEPNWIIRKIESLLNL